MTGREILVAIEHIDYSQHHIQAAVYFARKSARIERSFDPNQPPRYPYNPRAFARLLAKHRAYVTASIFSSIAFVEAAINELYGNPHHYSSNPRETHERLFERLSWLWGFSYVREKSSFFEKYDVASEVAGVPPVDKGRSPRQDVWLVNVSRNLLVHGKPEAVAFSSTESALIEIQEFEKQIASKHLPTNPLGDSVGGTFFPKRCLSYDYAKWAVNSCLEFTDAFLKSVGVFQDATRIGISNSYMRWGLYRRTD